MTTIRKGSVVFWLFILIILLILYKFVSISIIPLIIGYILILLIVNLLNPYEITASIIVGAIVFFAGMFSPYYGALLQALGALISFIGPLIALILQFFHIHFGNLLSFSISEVPSYGVWGIIIIIQIARHIYGRNNFGVFYNIKYFVQYFAKKEVMIDLLIVIAISVLFLQFSAAGKEMIAIVNQFLGLFSKI